MRYYWYYFWLVPRGNRNRHVFFPARLICHLVGSQEVSPRIFVGFLLFFSPHIFWNGHRFRLLIETLNWGSFVTYMGTMTFDQHGRRQIQSRWGDLSSLSGFAKPCDGGVTMKNISGWWFGTWILFSISYMGCHHSHWLIFFRGVKITNHEKQMVKKCKKQVDSWFVSDPMERV